MKKILNKIYINSSNNKIIGLFLLLISVFLLFPNIVFAVTWDDWIENKLILGLSWIIYGFVYTLGKLLTYIIGWMVQIASWNNFIDVSAVTTGWVIVRDMANMFFVLVLLIIAFATILRIESYSAKKLLPKLLIMTVLVNFSKTIFGLIIDFSQVIMLTFVSGFSGGGANNLTQMLGMDKMLSYLTEDAKTENLTWTNFAGVVVALFASIISFIVILAAMVVLLMRVIMIWIYVILSPLVFLGFAFPGMQKYTGRIWEDFIKQVVVGPVFVFFIWLALSTASNTGLDTSYVSDAFGNGIISGFLDNKVFQTYIITIGLLLGGLMVTQQIGGVAGGIAGRGMAWAKRAGGGGLVKKGALVAGGVAAGAAMYAPKQYAKRLGFGTADKALEQIKKLPIVDNLAMAGQAKLRMKREFAEEKDTRYMQYLSEQDLDKVLERQRSKGPVSFLAKGMESRRQGHKRALVEKMKRGEDWGKNPAESTENKTRAMIELAQLAGHSVTSAGEDSFRDAEIGKLWHDFRNKQLGHIDDDEMRAYYKGEAGTSGIKYKGVEGGKDSEYFKAGSPDSMMKYTASRLKEGQIKDLHHGQLTPEVLDVIYNDGKGPIKALAQLRDRGSQQQKEAMFRWMKHRQENAMGGRGDDRFKYKKDGGSMDNDFLRANADTHPLGKSRSISGRLKTADVASGITGLGKLETKGRLALNFSEIGLDGAEGKYFDDETGKADVAKRIGGKIKTSGLGENVAKSVEDQINKASYLILHNKEAGLSGAERKTTIVHENIHGRLSNAVNEDELRDIWDNKMTDDDRNSARAKVKKVYGNDKMSDSAVMGEYFTEGLTNKTRWKEKNPEKRVELSNNAEKGLEDLFKSKGSSIKAFSSNIHTEKPTQENIKQSVSSVMDDELKNSMKELTDSISYMGDGLSSIENVGSSMDDLRETFKQNNFILRENAKSYKDVSDKLKKFAE